MTVMLKTMQRTLPFRMIVLCFLLAGALALQAAAQCVTASAGGPWVNTSFPTQSSNFTAQFDVIPSTATIHGHVGLSNGPGNLYTDFANIIRFGATGTIDARNGGGYTAATTLNYMANATYHVRMAIDFSTHRYSVFVTPPSMTEVTIGSGIMFRSEQSSVASLNNFGAFVAATSGTFRVCNFAIVGSGPDFGLLVPQNSQSAPQGGAANYTVNVTPANGFNSDVTLTTSGLPAGVTPSFSPNPVAGGSGSSTLTLSVANSVTPNTYSFSIVGTGGGSTHSIPATLTVTPGALPGFTLSIAPGSQTVNAGSSAVYTVTAASQNNFAGSVTFSSVSGLLSGESASFSPGSIAVPAGGSGTSTLTVSTSPTTSGSSTLTVTGNSGTLSAQATTNLTVNGTGGTVLNVRSDCGATGNGSTNDAGAINRCIARASALSGGGTVEFPSGTYASSSIHMMSNVTLQLDSGATIRGSGTMDAAEPNPFSSFQDFGHSHFHDALIWGEHLSNVGFVGSGTIDGGGRLVTGNPSSGQGDKAISLRECNNVTVTGITIRNGGHFGILVNGIVGMTVDHVHIMEANQRDGFNLINSQHVTVTNSVIQGSDDSMCLKSDYALGRKVLNTDIQIHDDAILSTGNNATQFGSETCGSYSDVHFANLTITAAGKAGIGITSNDGAVIDGVTYDQITMSGTTVPIWMKTGPRGSCGGPPPPVGIIRNITISNVTAVHSRSPRGEFTNTISGRVGVPIQNVSFTNVNLTVPGGHPASDATINPPETENWQPAGQGTKPSYGWWMRHVSGISFQNCSVHFDTNDNRPAIIAFDGENISFNGFTYQSGSGSPYDFGFNGVKGFRLVGVTPTPRVNNVNSTPF
jgi:polygalacturonase